VPARVTAIERHPRAATPAAEAVMTAAEAVMTAARDAPGQRGESGRGGLRRDARASRGEAPLVEFLRRDMTVIFPYAAAIGLGAVIGLLITHFLP
jgi:hypothetical protein